MSGSLPDLERLAKFLGLLSSDHAGERAAAGLQAARLLGAARLSWPQLFDAIREGGAQRSAPPPPYSEQGTEQQATRRRRTWQRRQRRDADEGDWRHMARECLSSRARWSAWETEFLRNIADSPFLSQRQREILERLHEAAMRTADR